MVAVRLHQRRQRIRGVLLDIGLVGLGGWVAISGVAYGMVNLGQCEEGPGTLNFTCHFVPTLSPLWHPFVQHQRPAANTTGFIVVVLVVVARLVLPRLVTLVRLLRVRWAEQVQRQWLTPAGWRL